MKISRILLPLILLAGTNVFATVSVHLSAPTSQIMVGQTLTVTATAQDSAAPNTRFSYQFTVRPHATGPYIVQQDYYWTNTFPWTPSDHEGLYDVGVTAWSAATHNSAPTFMTVYVAPRVTSSQPVISATNNELVALYSAPACNAPAQMRVRFQPQSGGPAVYTPYKQCNGSTMNFYIGGMIQQTTYNVQQFLQSGSSTIPGPVLTWRAGSVPPNISIPNHFRLVGPQPPSSASYPFVLHAAIGAAPFATDLNENVVWYRPITAPYDNGYMVKLVPGGTFLTIDDDPIDSRAQCGSRRTTACGDHQFLRELDLAGNVIRSTSWAVVNDEVNTLRAKQGGSPVRLNFFSHEAIRLPNGYTVTMATSEQVKHLNSGTQDIFGDVIIALDTNWQVVWAWNSFDYLDINRMTIGGTCVTGGPGCPAQFFNRQSNGQLYTSALDWTHANSISLDTTDNNLIVSFRHQSQVIKINFANGRGNGNIMWRLGYGGSFALAPGYPVSDWFSGQHDARFMSNGLFTLFDNNNPSTVTQQPGGNAHGQAWQLDTTHMIATPVVNVDLGVVSPALGSAGLIANGNYHWQAGFVNNSEAQTLETTPSGTQVYKEQTDWVCYRTFRLQNLYTPQ